MTAFLDRLILGIPRLYIKQFPYAWIVFIVLWVWPPNIAIIFLLVVLLGLGMLQWQYAAWLRTFRAAHVHQGGKLYIDRPAVPLGQAARNILLLLMLSGLAGYFLQGQLRLTFWQITLIFVGFSLFYRDALFFGAPTTYIITDRGLGIYYAPGHLDYRLYFEFDEIMQVKRCAYQKDANWNIAARLPYSKDGLLLVPKSPSGFSKRMKFLFIVPNDLEKFLEQLPDKFANPFV